ncbi:MAG: hypothetical protein ACOCRN_02860 [Spirochaetia bacterium]
MLMFILLAGAFSLTPIELSAQDSAGGDSAVEQWFESTPSASRYDGIREELEQAHEAVTDEQIPDEPVRRFPREAAVKRVAPDSLLPAFEAHLDRLVSAAEAIDNAGGASALDGDPDSMLETAAAFLRTGATADTLSLLLEQAASARHAREAFFTLAELYEIDDLSDEQLRELGQSILGSGLSADSYGSVASLYVQGRARRRSASRVISAITDTLDEGGGLVQVRRALRQ